METPVVVAAKRTCTRGFVTGVLARVTNQRRCALAMTFVRIAVIKHRKAEVAVAPVTLRVTFRVGYMAA